MANSGLFLYLKEKKSLNKSSLIFSRKKFNNNFETVRIDFIMGNLILSTSIFLLFCEFELNVLIQHLGNIIFVFSVFFFSFLYSL